MTYAKLGMAAAISAGIFVLDLALPGGFAAGILYAIPLVLLLALRCERVWHAPAIASLASAFVIADIFLGAPGPSEQMTLANRGLTLLGLWIVTALVELGRRRAQQVVVERKYATSLFEAAIEAAADAMLVTDERGVIRDANRAATRVFGYPRAELEARPLASLVSERRGNAAPEQKGGILGAPLAVPRLQAGGPLSPVVGLRKDGGAVALETTVSDFERDGERLHIHAMRDVTDKRKLEERLLSAQRMEAIGRLAGGVAHDFNNLLAVMMSYCHFAADALAADHAVRADIDEVLSAAERASGLTRQLLAFSRRQVVRPLRLHPSGLISDMDKMLRRLIGENIELMAVGLSEEGLIEIDPSQLEQVVLNLVINARDALPNGGRITVELGNVTLDQEYCDTHPDVTCGDYVMLAVSDTGTGMTDDVRLRIFEPFFTTKAPGAGTGLGLSTVYGIVKQANGHVWVYSEPGRGSTFKTYFPRVNGAADAVPVARVTSTQGGSETVLIVEDEAPLRRVAVRVLKKAGYNVLEAGNGLDAIRKLDTGVKVDLLVTDVVMPMMGGRELAAKLLEREPELRVLYVSGYTENAIVHHGVLDDDIVFLQKPFQPEELLRRVRLVLDGCGKGKHEAR